MNPFSTLLEKLNLYRLLGEWECSSDCPPGFVLLSPQPRVCKPSRDIGRALVTALQSTSSMKMGLRWAGCTDHNDPLLGALVDAAGRVFVTVLFPVLLARTSRCFAESSHSVFTQAVQLARSVAVQIGSSKVLGRQAAVAPAAIPVQP